MKRITTMIAALILLATMNMKAQYVALPDTAFGTWLHTYYPLCVTGNSATGWHLDTVQSATLTTLNIGAGNMQPPIKNLSGLQYFKSATNIIFNSLPQLTSVPLLPTSVTDWQITDCPALHTVPAFPSALTSLSISYVSFTSLPAFPSTLTSVTLYQSQVAALPALSGTSLQYLDVEADSLIATFPTLPTTIQTIICQSNSVFTSLPTLPPSLLYLSCSYNPHLRSLPAMPSQLISLDCTHDSLTALPSLASTALQDLACEYNYLTILPSLPSSLRGLYCDHNQITSLTALPASLDTAYCQYNQIASIDAIPASLSFFWLDSNRLTTLPALPGYMSYLNCSHNRSLNCIPVMNVVEILFFDGTGVTCLPNQPNGNLTMSPSGLPICTAGNPNGCPVATGTAGPAGPDQTTCQSTYVQMAATGTGTWAPLPSNPTTTTISPATSNSAVIGLPDISGIYGYIWTSGGIPDTMYITVTPKPNAGTDQTLPCIFLPGGSVTMAAVGTGAWTPFGLYADSTIIANLNSPTTTISDFHRGGTYDYIWTNNQGCTDTVSVLISEAAPTPVLTSLGLCLPTDTLQVSGASTALTYTWYLNGSPIDIHHFPAFTIAGGNGQGGAANQLNGAGDISFDAGGNLYVLDVMNNRVQKFPAGSTPATNGVTVAGGNGQGATANRLLEPQGMFVTLSGDIYIADTYNNRIQKFPSGSTSATNATTVAGGAIGSAANQLNNPYGVYVDSAGYLYVADEGNHRVQRFPPGSTSATNGVTVAGGTFGSGAAQLKYPFGITVTGDGTMYVADAGNHRIQKFPSGSISGTAATTVAGGNGPGNAANQLNYPGNIFVETNGDLYVADTYNSRIQKFPAGSTSASNGITVAGGNGRDTAANQLNGPARVIRDASGYLYIADNVNNRVQVWSAPQMDSLSRPTVPGTYTATSTMYSGCVSAVSNAIVVNYCLSDSVWPGDADHNGLADNNDLLPLGIAYGLNGFTRADQSIVWTAHYAQNWGVQFLNGTNTKHADCNGDGVIDANDTTAILLNFGLTHAKTNGYGAPWRSGIPGITLHYSKDTVQQGDTLTVSLQLGDSATSVANIYGLAFTYHYDAIVVDTTTTQFNFINSFLSNSTNGMSISRDFKTTGTVKAAVTGINHTNRSGYGVIAKFIATITTGNINGKDLAYYSNINYISDITAIDKDENVITLNAGIDSNVVAYQPTGIIEPTYSRIQIYPNPAKDGFTIKADMQWANTEYKLSDVTGRSILTGRLKGGETYVSIAELTPGIYMLHFADQKQSYKVTKY